MARFPILVIDNILKKVHFNDLLSARSVSIDFNMCAIKYLTPHLFYVSLYTEQQMSDFLDIFSNSIHLIPFSQFILNSQVRDTQDLNKFIDLYGDKIVELCIDIKGQRKLFSPSSNEGYEEDIIYDEKLPHYLSHILSQGNSLEVLQIEADTNKRTEQDLPTISSEDLPPVPILPKLVILQIPICFQRYHPWMTRLVRNAPALRYTCPHELDYLTENNIYYPELRSRGIVNLNYCGYNADKKSWLRARARLRTVELKFAYFNEGEARHVKAQSRNGIAIRGCLPTWRNPLPGNLVFPRVQGMTVPCDMWMSGKTQLTPIQLPALRIVTVSGVEATRMRSPLVESAFSSVVYATVTEFRSQLHRGRSKIQPWPWHKIFPNVKVFRVDLHSNEHTVYLEYLVPKFLQLETVCLKTDKFDFDSWGLISGGIPTTLDMSGIQILEYTGVSLNHHLLPAILKSFQDGFLANVKKIIFRCDVPYSDHQHIQKELKIFAGSIHTTWWVPQKSPSGRTQSPIDISDSQ